MGHEPVANRTRGRRNREFERMIEVNKKARMTAKREWKKKMRNQALQISGQSEEEDDGFMIVDKDEFEQVVNLKRNNQRKDLGFEDDADNDLGFSVQRRYLGFEDDGGDNNVGCSEGNGEEIQCDGGKSEENPLLGFEENGNFVVFDDGESSDASSCKILGQRFCPWDNAVDDDVDVDDDLGADSAVGESSLKKNHNPLQESQISSQESSDSSTEYDDTEDDRDFRVDETESSSTSVSESSDGSIEEISEDYHMNVDDKGLEFEKQKNKKGEKRKRKENSEFRKVFDGLNLVSNPVTTENTSIARRTRSNWKQNLPKKKAKQGKYSSPIPIQEISSTDGEYDDIEEDYKEVVVGNGVSKPHNPNSSNVNHGGERKRGRPPKENDVELPPPSKKRRGRGFTDKELQRVLYNTLTDNGDVNLEESMPSLTESYLPLKFKFGIEEIIPPEKSEEDVELEMIWKQLDFILLACTVGDDRSCRVRFLMPIMFTCENDYNNEDFIPSDSAVLHVKLCAEGKHHLIYDEEVGIRCKFCSYVRDEIKYCTPDFNKNPFGKSENCGYGRFPYDGEIPLHQFQFDDNGYDPKACSRPSEGTWGTVWDLIPGIRRHLYPHQQEGIEFIWRNVAGGIKISELGKPRKDGLGGCIICHAPGTGKTRLAIVFLHSYMKQYPSSRPVIIAPSSVLPAWEEEFAKWKSGIPFLNMNSTDLPEAEDLGMQSILRNAKNEKTIRLAKLCTWKKGRGVLGISYSLFGKMTREKDGVDDKLRDVLLNKAGIMVLDEGHTPRNDASLIWKTLSNVTTRKKIILSGTPFQNNFHELYNIISLVREGFVDPLLADNHRDYQRKRGRKSASDEKRALFGSAHCNVDEAKRIEELRTRIKPFVHVYKGDILRETLRGLLDSVLILKPSDLQRKCLQHLESLKNSFGLDHWVSITSVHPALLLKCEHVPLFLDEEFKALLRKHEKDLDAGVKTRFSFELIKLSKGEKVLVFSQYINPLDHLGELLQDHFDWTVGREILYMDGKREAKQRQNLIKIFNDPSSEARVLLASTRACCEGIHLVGASRVVLLDVVWNPSVERQAISRAYRLGQEKNVHVYHLITSGTQECDKYYTMLSKDRLSELVFSASESEKLHNMAAPKLTVSEDQILDELITHEKTKAMFDKIIYQPKADDLIESFGFGC
ncbi:hypothetical protein Cgig2_026841 [Carnegiea gigantea]|uniref:Uncharacterized protein n=1 Tax=Carnegiea gigantea TaxID=171969 RepID=A0A9Q1QQQ8_9CARY|nr:hypothetical protein Cgig2_026841 [Carnegiea gigantea]